MGDGNNIPPPPTDSLQLTVIPVLSIIPCVLIAINYFDDDKIVQAEGPGEVHTYDGEPFKR